MRSGSPRNTPAATATTLSITSANPGIGRLAGWRGAEGTERKGRGPPNPNQLERLHRERLFLAGTRSRAGGDGIFKHANQAYLDFAVSRWVLDRTRPRRSSCRLYSEVLQSFRLAARGHGDRPPPDGTSARVETYFDPLPFWYRPFDTEAAEAEGNLSAACGHPAADGDVPLLGLAERLAAPTPRQQPSLCTARPGSGVMALWTTTGSG